MAYASKNNNKNFNKSNKRSKNNKFNKNKKKFDQPMEVLGIFNEKIDEKLFSIKIQSNDFPFPNSLVFQNDKEIGKIDEVYGKLEESYASVLVEKNFNEEDPFFCNKFLKREWLLPRTETLKKKENTDKNKTKKEFKKKEFNKRDSNKKDFKRNKNSGQPPSKNRIIKF